MKIIFVTTSLGYGGAAKVLSYVANHMARAQHDVVICNFNTAQTTQTLDETIRVIEIPSFSKRGFKRFQQIKFIAKQVRQEKADLIVSFLHFPNFLSIVAGKLTGTPVIVSERGDPFVVDGIVMKFMYSCYRFASGVVFQTDMARDFFSECVKIKSEVIPNPVVLKDDTIAADYDSAEKTIAYVARFQIVQKRQDIMLDAMKKVAEKHPGYVLKFFGDGSDEEKMKEYAKELGIENNVEFCGKSSNVLKDISSSELFVLSSDFEGIPNSLLEAMSIGLPCVSTDCSPGGARMLIENEKSGLVVPCRDAQALADGICRMIEDRQFAISCGKEATKVKERFALDKMMDKWENFSIKTVKEFKAKK